MLMIKVINKPKKWSFFYKNLKKEIETIGIDSIGIVVIISFFIGAVIAIQTALNLENPLIPRYYIGLATRDSMILEFCSTMVALILAGKVGSNIASEIGTMRITEQIDALDVMGINSSEFLILPKITAAIIFNQLLYFISIIVGLFGGYVVALFTDIVDPADYLYGLHYWYQPYYIFYSYIKTIVFAFIITSVSAYHGYYVKGGAREVGKASTQAVVRSSIIIIVFNLILTQLMLI